LFTHDGAANINLEQIAKFGLWQNPFLKIKFLSITFDGDVFFELSLMLSTNHNPSEM
jgi:hypothetical protein